MQTRLLHNFLVVAERRSITAAAEVLHITQPALTRNIHQLERIVGAKLFERLPTGVALTRHGDILARRAKLMEIEYRHALEEMRALDQGLGGKLRVGAGPVWMSTLLPPVLVEFNKQFPKVRIRLTSGVVSTLVNSLLTGDIDIMCGTLDFPPQAEIVKEPLLRISHVVIASKAHPLARQGVVSAKELSRYPWVALADDQMGIGRIGAYFAANGIAPPPIAFETTSIGTMQILQEGNYLTHFAKQMLPLAEKLGLTCIPHEGTFWEAEAGVAYRPSSASLKAMTSFQSMLKAALT